MVEPEASEGRSLGRSAQELAEQVKGLVQTEIALARQEMTGQTRELGMAGGMGGAAAGLAVMSAGTATAGLVLLLAEKTPPWIAAFAVSGAYAGGAAVLARRARQKAEQIGVPSPDQAIGILKDAAQQVTGS
ncbi:MAG: phage holin family protein [Solirubrobacterales bacterium]|nr:phage holin family protein [Solirubrobacterales bacterium]